MILLWRNWTVHNLICHPISEIFWLILRPFSEGWADKVSNAIHDSSIPSHTPETGVEVE
jgi:hypothetical protein